MSDPNWMAEPEYLRVKEEFEQLFPDGAQPQIMTSFALYRIARLEKRVCELEIHRRPKVYGVYR